MRLVFEQNDRYKCYIDYKLLCTRNKCVIVYVCVCCVCAFKERCEVCVCVCSKWSGDSMYIFLHIFPNIRAISPAHPDVCMFLYNILFACSIILYI